MDLPVVAAITCTRGRHSYLENCLQYLLDQDYKGKIIYIIFNNSGTEQRLVDDISTENKRIILINQSNYSQTGQPYSSTWQVFEDCFSYVPDEVELVNFMDDDDTYLPNHISEGVKGYLEGLKLGKVAYKPYSSWFFDGVHHVKGSNVFEPSIFVNKNFVKVCGFREHSAQYHFNWIEGAAFSDRLYAPEEGISTFVYNYMPDVNHLSQGWDNPDNFNLHAKRSNDEGDGLITPNPKARENYNLK